MKITIKSAFSAIASLVMLTPGLMITPANALTKIEIQESVFASSVPEIPIPGGHNVVLSLQNNRYIQAIWVDDPAILGVTTDRALCPNGQPSGDCGFATTLRLIQLSGALNIPGASFSQGSGQATVVSLLTTDRNGENPVTYQFLANTINGRSDMSFVAITPSAPVQVTSLGRINGSRNSDEAQDFAELSDLDMNLVRAGRSVALETGRANRSSQAWQSLERFIELLDEEVDLLDAASEAKVSMALLNELERMGSDYEQAVRI